VDVFHFQEVRAEEVEEAPGVRVRWVVDEKRGARNYAMRLFDIDPGAATPLHSHWYEQEMYVIEGRGTAVAPDGRERPVGPGSVMWVDQHEEHQVKNDGAVLLRLICVIPLEKHRPTTRRS